MGDLIWYIFAVLVGGYLLYGWFSFLTGQSEQNNHPNSEDILLAYQLPDSIPKELAWDRENIPLIRDTIQEVISLLGNHGRGDNYCNVFFQTCAVAVYGVSGMDQRIKALFYPPETAGPDSYSKIESVLARYGFAMDDEGFFLRQFSIAEENPLHIAEKFLAIVMELEPPTFGMIVKFDYL